MSNCIAWLLLVFFSDRQSVSQLVIHLSSNTVSRFSVTVVYSKVNRKIKFFIGIPCFVSGNSTDLLILIYLLTFVYVHLDHCQTRTQCSAWCSQYSEQQAATGEVGSDLACLTINIRVLFRKGWRRTRNTSVGVGSLSFGRVSNQISVNRIRSCALSKQFAVRQNSFSKIHPSVFLSTCKRRNTFEI